MSWKLVPISKVVTKCSTWNPITVAGGDFLYVDLSSIDKEKKIINPYLVNYTECQNAPSRARQIINNGDVLVATVRPNLNAVALVNQSFDGATASTGYCVLRPKPDLLLSEYLYYWVQTTSFIDDMTSKATGANYPAVSDKIIKESFIPLPPLAEQKRIAAILDKADAIRQKRQKAIELADEFLRSVFLDMFGDPVTNPKGFSVGTIRDLVDSANYGSSAKASETDGEFPILRMGNITYKGAIDFSDLKYIDLEEKDKPKYLAVDGDLLFNRTNSKELVGKSAVYDRHEPVAIAGYLIRVRPNTKGNNYYISGYLNSKHGKATLQNMSKSIVGMANINAQEMQDISILIPPRELQDEYERIVKRIKTSVSMHELALDSSSDLFNSISKKAFSGLL